MLLLVVEAEARRSELLVGGLCVGGRMRGLLVGGLLVCGEEGSTEEGWW